MDQRASFIDKELIFRSCDPEIRAKLRQLAHSYHSAHEDGNLELAQNVRQEAIRLTASRPSQCG